MVLISPNYSDYWTEPETYVNRFEDYLTNAISTDEGINHSEELLKEAVAVSASLVPVYWLTSKALRRFTQNWSPENAVLLNVAVSAGLFHIICEETGVNNWYLSNSIASKKAKKKYGKVGDAIKDSKDIRKCKGECGWKKGLDHQNFHS